MRYLTLSLIIILLGIGGIVWRAKKIKAPVVPIISTTTPVSDIVIDQPMSNSKVISPLQISGKAKGSWFFEASFPIKLLDATGNVIATGHAEATSDWMTADFVNFKSTLAFTTTSTTGSLEFSKDNPSGLPENDQTFFVPIKFK